MRRIAVYPGSFDPITNGHLDIIRRASTLFDHVVVAVLDNSSKKHTFSARKRMELIAASIRDIPGAEVDTFGALVVDYLRQRGSRVLIRGLRAVSDMEYEFQMGSMNRQLYPEVETVFLMPDERYTYLSSSIVKEVARRGVLVEQYVPPAVSRALGSKFRTRRQR